MSFPSNSFGVGSNPFFCGQFYMGSALGNEAAKSDGKENKLDPEWINKNPKTRLSEIGLSDYGKLIKFLKQHGHQLTCLNLTGLGHEINDDRYDKIRELCPNLNHLII